jgi:diguanylate cyclase (GGDEF)-like protein/putative nucleotidyltransferase with HDIG domain
VKRIPKLTWLFLVGLLLLLIVTGLSFTHEFLLVLVMLTAAALIYWLGYRHGLRWIATHDDLTRIANHRGFQQLYLDMFTEAERVEQPLSLLMIDLDHFKRFNDAHGHTAGDKMLTESLDVMAGYLRMQDVIARFGGEEFVILLPGADMLHARQIAEWMRVNMEETYFLGEEVLPNSKLTVSIGVASYPEMTHSRTDLMELADRALRKAKRSGRNRVEVYSTVLDGLAHELEADEVTHIHYVKSLMITLQAKDRYTYEHSERVTDYSVKIAERMGFLEEKLQWIRYGAFLHDIGKIEIDREILTKPGRLSNEEYEAIKKHPVLGARIVEPLDFLREALPIILYHHERIDGRGYPEGLTGDEIPIEARIVGVADAYDAMTSCRPYRSERDDERAVQELVRCAGTQFDEQVVLAFVKVIEEEKGRPMLPELPDVI